MSSTKKVKEQKEFKIPPPKPCRNFLAGKCQNGSKCKFLHDSSMVPVDIRDNIKGDNKLNKKGAYSSSSSSKSNNTKDSSNGFIYFDKFISKSIFKTSVDSNDTNDRTEKFTPHQSMISLSNSFKSGQLIADDDCISALVITLLDIIKDSDNNIEISSFIQNHLDFILPSMAKSIGMQSFIDRLLKIIRFKKDNKTIKEEVEQYLVSFQKITIDESRNQICNHLKSLIRIYDNTTTTVAVYGQSRLVLDAIKTLINDQEEKNKKNLHIIVIDSRPLRLGMYFARNLVECGIHCIYTPLAGCFMHLKSCDYVLLSPSGLTPTGASTAVGTAAVASMASTAKVPVILLCETYKLIQTPLWDAFSWNSLGSGEELVCSTGGTSNNCCNDKDNNSKQKQKQSQSKKTDSKSDEYNVLVATKGRTFKGPATSTTIKSDVNSLRVLNPRYDVTPIELLSYVVTEMGSMGNSNTTSSDNYSNGISSQVLQLSKALIQFNE